MVMGKLFRVYHKISPTDAYSVLLENKNDKSESLLFESGTVGVLSQQETDTLKPIYSFLTDVYGCLGVLNITFGDGNNFLYLVCVTSCVSVGKIFDSEIFCINDTVFLSLNGHQMELDRIQDVKKNLNSGTFFFSWTPNNQSPKFDLTLCAQKYERTKSTDNRFFWNRMLYLHLKSYDVNTEKWLLKVMCGGVNINTVYVAHKQAKACLISRLSCERAGTRFNVRGTNDNGHVANFVETEQVIFLEDKITSFILIRGSIPLFWEQTGVQVGTHKLKMSRGCEISQPAFDRHFAMLQYLYGKQVIVNLVANTKDGEKLIGSMYKIHHKNSPFRDDIPYFAFDYHYYCPRGKEENLKILHKQICKYFDEFGFYYSAPDEEKSYQNGTFRVNCIDCLDRTNRLQTYIGLLLLKKQLKMLKLDENPTMATRFTEVYKSMWQINGDQVSRIYAGTGALEGKSKLRDGTLSVARTIQNNLLDNSKQEAIDILLTGKPLLNEYSDKTRSLLPAQYLHLPSSLLLPISERCFEYTELSTLRVAVGTWNVNGGKHFNNIVYKKTDPLSDWLLDADKSRSNVSNLLDLSLDSPLTNLNSESPDFYAIGFEEIVDLNAQNIMVTSTTNQREWLSELEKTLSRHEKYVLISSVQLVGVCLYLFTKPKFARHIRDVSTDTVKTGLGGAAGNKGGVGIRFLIHNTSLCFICSHFAAGQNQYNERNSDFREISKKMFASIGKHLSTHDYVFWCGDFNYRIDLPNDECKQLIKEENWEELLANDQLRKQQSQKKVFQGYKEGDIVFPPTYKYDMNSDDYDTSEKARIPAWTDRVLFRKHYPTRLEEQNPAKLNFGEIIFYGRAELKTSDHRPVIGEFKIDVLKVENDKRSMVFRDVVEKLGPTDATVIIKEPNSESFESSFEDKYVQEILRVLTEEVGEIILARFGDDHMRVTFKDGRLSLKLAEAKDLEILDKKYEVSLKTPNWIELIEEEVNYGVNNTIPLLEGCEKINIDELNDYDISKVTRPNSPEEETGGDVPAMVPSRPPPPRPNGVAKAENSASKPVRPAPPPPRPQQPMQQPTEPITNNHEPPNETSLNDSFGLPPPMAAPPVLDREASFDGDEEASSCPPPAMPPPNIPPPIPVRRPPPVVPPRNN